MTLFFSFLSGSLASLILMMLGKIQGKRAIVPFGPFLALGSVLAMWAGDAVASWYFKLLFRT